MNNFLQTIGAIEYRRLVPAILFVVAVAAYGLFIGHMGFYWDDLPISWIKYQLGAEALKRYFSEVRPLWAMLYQLTTSVLPQQPIYWQLFAITLRWLTAVVLWAVMIQLFPRRQTLAFALSLLMLVYPGFNQQWVSFLYSHFFIVFLCLLLSWFWMLRKKVLLALLFSALNLWMLEYFFFLELARPLMLWIALRDEPLTAKERLMRVLKTWIPYLIVLALAVFYRVFVFNHPGFGYSLEAEIRRAPVDTLLQLLQRTLSDLWTVTVAAWMKVFQFPNPVEDGSRITVLYLFVVLGVALLLYWFMFVRRASEQEARRNDAGWLLLLGGVLLLLGGIAFWLANVTVSLEVPASRATLSFLLGACFFLTGLLDLLPQRVKYAVVLLLVSLAAGRQFLWANEFRRDWEAQKNLFWQMTWRAPGLKPDTMVLMNEVLIYSADNSISAPLNWIYAPDLQGEQIPYVLFYPTNRLGGSLPELKPDLPIVYSYEAGKFRGNTSDALAFYYDPPACLRLLDPDLDVENRFILDESLMREAAALSNPERILREPSGVMPEIYGPEPEHRWCYYFEQAELARQFGDWREVVRLGNMAFVLDDSPNNPVERFVFIEGHAHVDDWERAVELSKVSYRVSKDYVAPLLCKLWRRIEAQTVASPERSDALNQIQDMAACPAE
ncbi:MAG TPA: hypothetical protein VFR47_31960 [Anaerolineales bacterium]|nr:hypothetical protein [Anaerolineales bacterium]